MKAMSVDKEQRQADAGVLAREIGAWLDGSKRREQALAVVEEAEAKAPERENLLRKAAALRVEAALFLQEIEPWRPEADKFEGWAKEDEALLLDERCELLVHEQEQLLQASLTHLPDLPEAHIALAKMYRGQHVALERDHLDTLRVEGLLRYHTEALPVDHPERLEYERYLSGDGSLTLITEPSGAEVALFRYELRHRRLVPTFVRSLGVTPLEGVELKRGSYMCVVTHPERREVRYPVCINRGEQWEGVRPSGDGDGAVAETVNLPYSDDLGENDIFIAPGWFLAGGDHNTTESLSRRHVWVDAFVMRRFSLTNGEYIEFLNDMVANGKEEEALSRAPRDRAGKLMYGFESGYFELVTDEDGDKWEADWPVCMINWFDAVKYTEWLSERTGEAWRLPHEIEWEKAARGVDGRFRPWGDGFDSSWAITFNSHEHRPLPAVVDSYPVDCSVYGVRGLAGNMVDWCCHLYDIEQPEDGQALVFDSEQMPSAIVDDSAYRAARGGSCYYSEAFIRVCLREHHYPGVTFSNVGFRLVRSI
jgi:serine/threonine-protein kinase